MKFDPQTDEIAQQAARLVFEGETDSVRKAIRIAMIRRNVSFEEETRRPSVKLVRDHLRGIAMEALGEDGYQQRVQRVFCIAEEVMTVLEAFDPELVGRLARGHIDGDLGMYMHVFTRTPIGEIVEQLVQHEYEEPEFLTAETKTHGRLDRIRFVEESVTITITRCSPDSANHVRGTDLYTDKPIASLNLDQLRKRMQCER